MAKGRLVMANKPAARVHVFALASGLGWLIDLWLFGVLTRGGLDIFTSNIISAGVAVSIVFGIGWRHIFNNVSSNLFVAIGLYVFWNILAIALASVAIKSIAHWAYNQAYLFVVQEWVARWISGSDLTTFVPVLSKILVTPVTMYSNFVAMGFIIERRIRLI